VTPSGDGIRIWGLANGEPLHRKFTLEIDDKGIAAELFRRTNKPLTITGYTLDPAIKQLTNIDCRYTIEQIEAMIRNGAPPGSDRSAVFHAIIGHLSGCGWDAERIYEHVGQFPDGIGAKYIAEGRLTAEIARSLGTRSRSAADQELADQTADSGCRARTVERPVGCRQNLRGV
jgi:hypothetical protein